MRSPNNTDPIDQKIAPKSPDHCRPADHPEHLPWPPEILSDYQIKVREHVKEEEKPEKAFNYDLAVEAFGSVYMEKLKKKQERFQGDWFQLAFLLRCHDTPIERRGIDPDQICCCHFCQSSWNSIYLGNAKLGFAQLENVNLRNAHLENACLCNARLDNANLREARLDSADIRGADITGAKLEDAELEGADVRGVKGIVFDANKIDGFHIEGNAPDPWSVLRRAYTGPRFFFHLLLLTAFILSYVGKMVVLSGIYEGMVVVDKKVVSVLEKLEQSTDYQKSLHGAVGKATENLPDSRGFVESLHETTESRIDALPSLASYFKQLRNQWQDISKKPALWVLLGIDNWKTETLTFFPVSLVMILYNIFRLIFTREVSFLRDAEERSRITPSRKEYMGETDQEYDSRSFWVVSREALKMWYSDFTRWWKDGCCFALHKLWNMEVWVWEQRKNKGFCVVTVMIVALFWFFCWSDRLFLRMWALLLLIAFAGWVFGLMKGIRDDGKPMNFNGTLLPPSPIKHLGLYRLHQIATVFMYIGYCALVIQIFWWLWDTKIPTF
jgi:hypothetical protein